MGSRAALVLLVALSGMAGCANQQEVIPLLHVEPNAGARMLYFERRSRELFGAKVEAPQERDDVAEPGTCEPPPLKTWGTSPDGDAGSEGTSCDPERND